MVQAGGAPHRCPGSNDIKSHTSGNLKKELFNYWQSATAKNVTPVTVAKLLKKILPLFLKKITLIGKSYLG